MYLVENATNDQISIYHTSEDMERVEEFLGVEGMNSLYSVRKAHKDFQKMLKTIMKVSGT